MCRDLVKKVVVHRMCMACRDSEQACSATCLGQPRTWLSFFIVLTPAEDIVPDLQCNGGALEPLVHISLLGYPRAELPSSSATRELARIGGQKKEKARGCLLGNGVSANGNIHFQVFAFPGPDLWPLHARAG